MKQQPFGLLAYIYSVSCIDPARVGMTFKTGTQSWQCTGLPVVDRWLQNTCININKYLYYERCLLFLFVLV